MTLRQQQQQVLLAADMAAAAVMVLLLATPFLLLLRLLLVTQLSPNATPVRSSASPCQQQHRLRQTRLLTQQCKRPRLLLLLALLGACPLQECSGNAPTRAGALWQMQGLFSRW
jgi:hypothetical protein